jgi:hypothetical protein
VMLASRHSTHRQLRDFYTVFLIRKHANQHLAARLQLCSPVEGDEHVMLTPKGLNPSTTWFDRHCYG